MAILPSGDDDRGWIGGEMPLLADYEHPDQQLFQEIRVSHYGDAHRPVPHLQPPHSDQRICIQHLDFRRRDVDSLRDTSRKGTGIGILVAHLNWAGNRHNSGCKEFRYVGAFNLLQVAVHLDLCLVEIQHTTMKISFVYGRTPCTAFRPFTVVQPRMNPSSSRICVVTSRSKSFKIMSPSNPKAGDKYRRRKSERLEDFDDIGICCGEKFPDTLGDLTYFAKSLEQVLTATGGGSRVKLQT
ncbi:hypothetical protein PCH_Pc12g10070 [Penicillium rubens Wisconsin 54-1255]|uniref:Uncharacterized protein n=1 Tax=Penicillium rubens (strain ATCC 28089 / DSM 1075 / NRRL 1951 / Wisconsin 54-1255) TaxID=500485 RepID=B6H078_PENRW|nr:hypothetical protein PCH_Pc12g10070 [Penicillium rubens Wisconsin 54-1255]